MGGIRVMRAGLTEQSVALVTNIDGDERIVYPTHCGSWFFAHAGRIAGRIAIGAGDTCEQHSPQTIRFKPANEQSSTRISREFLSSHLTHSRSSGADYETRGGDIKAALVVEMQIILWVYSLILFSVAISLPHRAFYVMHRLTLHKRQWF